MSQTLPRCIHCSYPESQHANSKCPTGGRRFTPLAQRAAANCGMEALTVRQPYASLIMCGAKPFEFRTRPTRYRGPLLIHAGAQLHTQAEAQFKISCSLLPPPPLPKGSILGVVDLVDCCECRTLTHSQRRLTRHCGFFGEDWFAWKLENPRTLNTPLPANGRLGLWTPTPEQLQSVLDALHTTEAA